MEQQGYTKTWVDALFSAPSAAFALAALPGPIATGILGGYFATGGAKSVVSDTASSLSSGAAAVGQGFTAASQATSLLTLVAVLVLLWAAVTYGPRLMREV
jgi:hypothetical protein